MSSEISALLDLLIKELDAHPKLLVEEAFAGPGLSGADITRSERETGVTLAPSVRDFYRQVNGVVIEWILDPNERTGTLAPRFEYEEPVYGSVNILTLDEMLAGGEGFDPAAWSRGMDVDAASELQRFRPFDENVEEAYSGLLVHEGIVEDRLFYLERDAEYLIDTQQGISDYVRALCESKGFYWWQRAFALGLVAEGTDAMHYYLSRLFPSI